MANEFKIDDSTFKKQMVALKNDYPNFAKEMINKIGARMLNIVKKLTPVGIYPKGSGKTGGNLRRNWTLGEAKSSFEETSIEIFNNTEYALPVEEGHITKSGGFVAGRYMLKSAFTILEGKAQQWIYYEVQKFIKKHGGD